MRASAGDLAVHGALLPCVCLSVRYQTPFSSRHESGPGLFLLTGKHPVVGQLPRVSFSALPGQSSGRPNLPPYPSAITALFLDRSLVVVHLTGHDQIMTVEILGTMLRCAYCMSHASRSTGSSYWCSKQPRAVCRKCFMFHLDRVDLRRWCIMPAIDRKCFDCKKTTKYYCNEAGHAQRLNMLKQRPRKWFFAKKLTFIHRWRS